MTGPQLAVRVRRARAQSVCALCDRLIRVGDKIGKLPAGGWAHAADIVKANRNARPERH